MTSGNREGSYDPADLTEIDAGDVVALDSSAHVQGVREFIRLANVRETKLMGRDAQAIAELWRRLTPAEPARCHIPPYGLRFWLAGHKIVEASLCWECNNAYGYAGHTPVSFTFDATAPAAVSLLMQLRRVLPAKAG